jgi:transcriptional regulator of arginine metabolism
MAKIVPDSFVRLNLLRKLLAEGEVSTQEGLVEELLRQKFKVTQSTISRDLRRLGAIKTVDSEGGTVYRLPEDFSERMSSPSVPGGLKSHLLDIQHNNSMIVIHTMPGSASLVARHLDQAKPAEILGTIAGDDTIFVVPSAKMKIAESMRLILEELS